ncbi:MAG: aldo/keto reductase [Clostridiales bacterium]|jgi:aryl-alcohol dehydrogenase-like predicted oxidoreductase|nr:aldo/keto reductase [Clostridiales bacterium]
MEQVFFGKTNLRVSRTGFGCIPIQRIPYEESTAILRRAYENGITLFDTANAYSTSEDRIGTALGDVRKKIVICTKTGAQTPDGIIAHLENSLRMLQTDYIDVLQFHCPGFIPQPGGEDGMYDCLLKAKAEGKIRFIGITAHKKHLAFEAVESGLYATMQYPFSYLSSQDELALIDICREKNVGILGMKSLCGGILTNAKAAFAFLRRYSELIPIWGIQKMHELEEIIQYENNPPVLDNTLLTEIEADRKELAQNFCRACGYCLPCPANIPIPMAARMEFLLGRMPAENFRTPEWQENMRRIEDCTNCGHCKSNCPYELDAPELLKKMNKSYFAGSDSY